jgi:signal transduction histidine kinase
MKANLARLSQRYEAALRKHLNAGPRGSLNPALSLGHQSVRLGLETLGLARIHQLAVATLDLSLGTNRQIKAAEVFFTEALAPIVETHRAARQNKLDLNRLNETLIQRNAELASSSRQLRRGIARRETVEAALKRSGEHYAKLLTESLRLQEHLRRLTHQVLTAQENERKNMSRQLQDEVVQSLLGINVRLLSLKRDAKRNSKGLKKEISSTQRLVAKSARSVRKGARDFRNA